MKPTAITAALLIAAQLIVFWGVARTSVQGALAGRDAPTAPDSAPVGTIARPVAR